MPCSRTPPPLSDPRILATSHCRICHHELKLFVDFGKMPIANSFLRYEDFSSEFFYRLQAAMCPKCWMVQLTEQPVREMLFHKNYPFFTASSLHMTLHFEALAEEIKSRFLSHFDSPLILEIGSNDGTFLSFFLDDKVRCLGIEPSLNVANKAQGKGIPTLCEFFNPSTGQRILQSHGPADCILAANVFCHLPDLSEILSWIPSLLTPQGIIVFEDPYWPNVLEKTSYDQMYDEHVFLFSLTSITHLLARHGLEVFDIQPQNTHGGSMRYYVCQRNTYPVSDAIQDCLQQEQTSGIQNFARYQAFASACEHSKKTFKEFLLRLKKEGRSIAGYAATSKSSTVLNYAGIGPDLISFICDSTPQKQGLWTPGTHIPIVPIEHFRQNPPDYTVLFGWNHQKEILEKEQDYSKKGKWISFVPKVGIL